MLRSKVRVCVPTDASATSPITNMQNHSSISWPLLRHSMASGQAIRHDWLWMASEMVFDHNVKPAGLTKLTQKGAVFPFLSFLFQCSPACNMHVQEQSRHSIIYSHTQSHTCWHGFVASTTHWAWRCDARCNTAMTGGKQDTGEITTDTVPYLLAWFCSMYTISTKQSLLRISGSTVWCRK